MITMNRLITIIVCILCIFKAQAQTRNPEIRHDVPLDSIRLSDPAILADQKTKMYYMTGTGGMMWRSHDLKLWEGPFRVTEFDKDSWMGPNPMIWAAELHQTGDGWYYYFATFTNREVKIDTVRGNVIERRACQVLRSDNPMGPYRTFGDATYLPAYRPTLDGTLWRDTDGKPYMVFCGEWLQNWNGTIEKIELKLDFRGTVGEPKILFRASDSPWSREKDSDGNITWNKVTDGPWLFRTGTGRLGMLWTSWVFGDYTQGVAYSESGTLDGPWIQEPNPITPPNFGHSMLFQRFDGQWMMSIHSHSNDHRGRTVRIPHLFEVDLSGDKLIVNTDNYEVDVFKTKSGKVVKFHALMHSSIRIEYDGKEIEIDPCAKLRERTVDYTAMPKADYLFVTHEHFDHYDSTTIALLTKEQTQLIMNKRCVDMYGSGTVMVNGQSKMFNDIKVEAVPAYNTTEGHLQFHPKGRDNGYILTLDGLRIYIAGDTEDIPEMENIKDIDIAFLPCNQPFTMTPEQLVRAAKVIKPKVLFPYHYGHSTIPQQLQSEGIDVRIRHYE